MNEKEKFGLVMIIVGTQLWIGNNDLGPSLVGLGAVIVGMYFFYEGGK